VDAAADFPKEGEMKGNGGGKGLSLPGRLSTHSGLGAMGGKKVSAKSLNFPSTVRFSWVTEGSVGDAVNRGGMTRCCQLGHWRWAMQLACQISALVMVLSQDFEWEGLM